MLRSGTTTAVDFLYEAPAITLETLEPVVQAYRDAGLRATILLGVADLPVRAVAAARRRRRGGGRPRGAPPTFASIMELAEAAIERLHEPGGLIGIGLGPSAPQRCSPQLLQATPRVGPPSAASPGRRTCWRPRPRRVTLPGLARRDASSS